jgi:small subunit ribosomal protein S7e
MTDIKKVSAVFEKSKTGKTVTLTHLEQQVSAAFADVANHFDADSRKLASLIVFSRATEVTFQKDKSFVLVYVSFRSSKILLTPVYKKLVTELEKRLKKTVLILSNRKIQSRWIKENRTQKRPNSRTLSAVYSAILD